VGNIVLTLPRIYKLKTMRKLLLFAALIATMFASCDMLEDRPSSDESNFLVLTKLVEIAAEGGEGVIEYTISQPTEGLEVSATTNDEWITNITVEKSVRFSVAENKDKEQRVGFITLAYGAEEHTVGVQQAGGSGNSVTIFLEQRKLEVTAKGGEYEIGYTMSGAEEGAIPEVKCEAEWIDELNIDGEKLSFVVAKNPSVEQRKANITLSYGGVAVQAVITQKGATHEVILTVSNTTPRVGQSITFSVEYAGEDVTSEAKICNYYTSEVIANPVTFNEVGEHAIVAKYDGQTSNDVSVAVYSAVTPDFPVDGDAENYNFKYRMLLIDHTGTDCGYCPYMMQSLKEIEEDPAYNDYFNIAMAHSYNMSDPAFSNSALTMRYYYQKTLKVLTGFPTLTFNYQYPDSAGSNISYIYRHLDTLKKERQSAAVAVATKIDGDKIVVSASLKSKEARHYKFNIFLLEDNIYGSQSNAYESWMNIHNNAIRDSYSVLSNSDITGSDWGYISAESTSSKVFEMAIPSTVIRRSELKVLVVIAAQDSQYNNKYEVVNTTMCKLGASVPFEYVD
jgi:thiol-disulfide isomerase/thioredoxin